MKTETHSIHDVLAKNATSFFIPPFQRAYAWGKQEIERFFNDILRIIDSELDPNQKDKQEHFFGTIVVKEEKAGFSNKSIIVDGQQRLTTALLFLIALRDIEEDPKKKEQITTTYLLNQSSTFQDKIKLKQVTKDWEAYRALVNNQNPPPGAITSAYRLLKKLIQEQKQLKPQITIDHYITAIQRLHVAVIFLDERPFKGEDPQIIFETLNSLGKPLTLSDLVRNFVLLRIESDKQTEIYEKIWHPQIESVLNDDTSKFFRDYLQYKKSTPLKVVSDNNTKELYQQFKEFVEFDFENNNDFINDILKYVKLYKWIITEENYDIISPQEENDKRIKELLRNIFHDIESEAFKPFVLGLLEYHQYGEGNTKITDEILISILETIRTYLIRRRILKLAQGENKNIVLLCKRIKEIAQGRTSIIELLTSMFYSLRFPNDEELRGALMNMNFYEELKQYSKFILGKIEEHNSKVSVNFRDEKISIEHIMPQNLNDAWKAELGDNYEEIHRKYLHNIGNLILTEFNSEMGNKPFSEKKERLKTSNLYFRHDIINRDRWNQQSIEEHRENMIKWLLDTFPLPEEYKYKNGWKSGTNEGTSEVEWLSPIDIDAGDIAEGNKPVELHIFNKSVVVKTWGELFLNFVKYLKEYSEEYFKYIIENQYELFGRDDVFLKWKRLKEKIEKNNVFAYHYKTLDGKTWYRVKDLNENTLFCNVAVTAKTFIARIANIVNKLYMNEDDVKIKLKS
jgi:uncharacterized protein with ParB-like and HNH nuclease domain